MADQKQLDRLTANVQRWNRWRRRHPRLRPDLSKADLSVARLSVATLSKADLSVARLSEADLSKARLSEADLSEADLSEADLSEADLIRATLSKADLSKADLSGADLEGADLRGSDLRGAHLRGSDLRGAHLSKADLHDANLRDANLRDANLSGAHLIRADLREADLREADLFGVNLYLTLFGHTNLSHAHGLDTCRHYGPSYLDHFTLFLSGGLPDAFLRSSGYLDWEIEAAKLHQSGLSQQDIIDITYRIADLKTDDPIQYQSCFISHSSADEPFCRKLHDRLQDKGVRCWFSPEHIRWGDKLRFQLDAAIQQQDRLLLVLTETSMQSPWVEYELRRAIAREDEEQRRILFPLSLVPYDVLRDWTCFDADTGRDLARAVREFFIPDDFTAWEDDAVFQRAFDRLLENLRRQGSEKNPA